MTQPRIAAQIQTAGMKWLRSLVLFHARSLPSELLMRPLVLTREFCFGSTAALPLPIAFR
jgi:hypothetical protein